MRAFKILIATVALSLGLAGAIFAQTSVQQVPSRLDAGTNVAVGTNFATVASTSVATATVGAGLYAYITNITIDVCGDASANGAVMSNVLFTSAGIAGAPSWQYSTTTTGQENTCIHLGDGPYSVPLKSAAPGTNVTVTSPASGTHISYGIKIYYYLAP